MKKCVVWVLLVVILTSCSGKSDELETGLQFRSKLLQAAGCSFHANVSADYGDKMHTFALNCKSNDNGDLMFTVTDPNTISGITGNLSGDGGNLTFDQTALHFELLTEERLSPISAPWIMLKSLRTGYITSCCTEDQKVRLSIDDSYEEDALRVDIWLDQNGNPEKAEILYDGRKILSVLVEKFELL